jgi:GTP 3',8-cyclase
MTSIRDLSLTRIKRQFIDSGTSLEDAIRVKDLYFRISLVGSCNLACPFCHNEGAPIGGIIEIPFVLNAIQAASDLGFNRIQFTGGEPLLHPDIYRIIANTKNIVSDVGITTNGTFLQEKFNDLIQSGLKRMHVSLQVESLIKFGRNGEWGIPDWLLYPLEYFENHKNMIFRLNVPVPVDHFLTVSSFLELMSGYDCDINLFPILSNDHSIKNYYPIESLANLTRKENIRRQLIGKTGKILRRKYYTPQGIRCETCYKFNICQEQSHSLRLGSDHILRPCLATRLWDSKLTEDNALEQIEEATWLALDF